MQLPNLNQLADTTNTLNPSKHSWEFVANSACENSIYQRCCLSPCSRPVGFWLKTSGWLPTYAWSPDTTIVFDYKDLRFAAPPSSSKSRGVRGPRDEGLAIGCTSLTGWANQDLDLWPQLHSWGCPQLASRQLGFGAQLSWLVSKPKGQSLGGPSNADSWSASLSQPLFPSSEEFLYLSPNSSEKNSY